MERILNRKLARLNNEIVRLMKSGEYDRVDKLLKEKYRITQELYGDKKIETISAMNLIAINYYRMEQYDKALPLLRKVLKLRTQVQGRFYEGRITALQNICAVLKTDFSWDKMPELLKTEKELCLTADRVLGAVADTTIDIRHEYALDLFRDWQYEEAFSVAKENYDICYHKYGFIGKRTQTAINDLQEILDKVRRSDETVRYLEKIYNAYITYYGNGNEKTLYPMSKLCRALVDHRFSLQSEDYKLRAISLAKQCLKLCVKIYADPYDSHASSVTDVLEVLIDGLERCGKYEEACDYQIKLMEWTARIPDDFYYWAGKQAARLVDLMLKAGKPEEAEAFADEVLPELLRNKKLYGPHILHIRALLERM